MKKLYLNFLFLLPLYAIGNPCDIYSDNVEIDLLDFASHACAAFYNVDLNDPALTSPVESLRGSLICINGVHYNENQFNDINQQDIIKQGIDSCLTLADQYSILSRFIGVSDAGPILKYIQSRFNYNNRMSGYDAVNELEQANSLYEYNDYLFIQYAYIHHKLALDWCKARNDGSWDCIHNLITCSKELSAYEFMDCAEENNSSGCTSCNTYPGSNAQKYCLQVAQYANGDRWVPNPIGVSPCNQCQNRFNSLSQTEQTEATDAYGGPWGLCHAQGYC